jgi:mannose-6-phosphate isomerase-like protein (cupin superfamily)
MPVFKSGLENTPTWCEVTFFEIVRLRAGEVYYFERVAEKEKLFLCAGSCGIQILNSQFDAESGWGRELETRNGAFIVHKIFEPTTLVRICGHWGSGIGSSGLFTLRKSNFPLNSGDPTPYDRNTVFDNHYHDFDEYWIIVNGRGRVVTEGKTYDVGPGDCVATGMGHHHDFPLVVEEITGVYFETTLAERKRLGHLWNHTHGTASPKDDRI